MSLPIRIFVWLGGVLFVAALAATASAFFVTWGRTRPFTSWTAVLVDAALLTVFAGHHSLFARSRVKGIVTRLVPARLERSVYVWIASLLLLLVVAAWQPVGAELYSARGAVRVVFAALQVAGVWLTARSAGAIDALELAGIRQAAGTRSNKGLQFHGPYRIVRHPIYLGWILIVFGTPHMTGDRFTFAALTTAYLALAIPWEERGLEQSFGADYAHYKASVRWRVLPFIY